MSLPQSELRHPARHARHRGDRVTTGLDTEASVAAARRRPRLKDGAWRRAAATSSGRGRAHTGAQDAETRSDLEASTARQWGPGARPRTRGLPRALRSSSRTAEVNFRTRHSVVTTAKSKL